MGHSFVFFHLLVLFSNSFNVVFVLFVDAFDGSIEKKESNGLKWVEGLLNSSRFATSFHRNLATSNFFEDTQTIMKC